MLITQKDELVRRQLFKIIKMGFWGVIFVIFVPNLPCSAVVRARIMQLGCFWDMLMTQKDELGKRHLLKTFKGDFRGYLWGFWSQISQVCQFY